MRYLLSFIFFLILGGWALGADSRSEDPERGEAGIELVSSNPEAEREKSESPGEEMPPDLSAPEPFPTAEGSEPPQTSSPSSSFPSASPSSSSAPPKVTLKDAIDAALSQVHGLVREGRLEEGDGTPFYRISITRDDGTLAEVEVDGASGQILKVEKEEKDGKPEGDIGAGGGRMEESQGQDSLQDTSQDTPPSPDIGLP